MGEYTEQKAYAEWAGLVLDQGWTEGTQLSLLEDFLRSQALMGSFLAYAKERSSQGDLA